MVLIHFHPVYVCGDLGFCCDLPCRNLEPALVLSAAIAKNCCQLPGGVYNVTVLVRSTPYSLPAEHYLGSDDHASDLA